MIAIDEREKKVSFPTNLWILWVFISVAAVVVAIGMAFNWSFIPKLPPSTVIVSTATPTPEPTVSTATPTVAPTDTLTPELTETPVSDIFIVLENFWNDAFILHVIDGTQLPAIAFSEAPLDMQLRAPIRGHLRVVDINPGWDAEVLVIAEDEDWTLDNPVGRSVAFAAQGFNLLVKDKVSEGEVFASIRENGEMGTEYYAEKVVLIIGSIDSQMKPIDQSITDLKAYLWAVIQATE